VTSEMFTQTSYLRKVGVAKQEWTNNR